MKQAASRRPRGAIRSPHKKQFRVLKELLYSQRSLRAGICCVHEECPPGLIADFVGELARNRMYSEQLAPAPFPPTFAKIRPRGCPRSTDLPREISWTAAILALFSGQLRDFVEMEWRFYTAYLSGDYDAASATLDEVESRLGYSFWSIR